MKHLLLVSLSVFFAIALGAYLPAQTITILYPNGGENMVCGEIELIQWTWTGTIDSVRVDYSINGGATWLPVEQKTLNDSICGWNVPNRPGNALLVKVTDASNPSILDISDNNFSITSSVTVTSPSGGANWEVGSLDTITWDASPGITDVKIDYSVNGGTNWTTLVSSTPNNGRYPWNVPNKPTSTALVRVTDTDNTAILDMSDLFSVTTQIVVVSPNGGENWEVGSLQDIIWNASPGISDVKIEFSTNGGGTWQSLITSTLNSGTYGWKVPDTPYNTFRIKVTDYANTTISDMSDNNFTVFSALDLMYPNGGELFYVGEEQIVIYGASDGISEIKFEYSTNNGTTWSQILITENDSSIIWNIPNRPSTQCLFRITDNSFASSYDVSDDTFEINTGLKVEEEKPHMPVPGFFSQSQNMPNPFKRETCIRYALPIDCHVSIRIYDISGKFIRSLVDKQEKMGYKVIRWNGTDETGTRLPTGVYFYRMNAGPFSDTKKFVLL